MPRNAFSQTGLHPNWLMPSSLAACGFAICTHCLPLTHPAPVTLKKITDCSQSMISLNVNKLVTYLLFKMIIPKTKLATKEPYKKTNKEAILCCHVMKSTAIKVVLLVYIYNFFCSQGTKVKRIQLNFLLSQTQEQQLQMLRHLDPLETLIKLPLLRAYNDILSRSCHDMVNVSKVLQLTVF